MILAIVDDLLFSSKIRAAAGAAGAPINFARTKAAAIDALQAQPPAVMILDLDRIALEPMDLIRHVRADPSLDGVSIVAFASHVHADAIRAAREAGADRVLARSGFVAALPEIVSGSQR